MSWRYLHRCGHRARLAPLRSHVSTAATMLREPTPANLRRVAERVEYATKQFALLTKVREAKRGSYQRQWRCEGQPGPARRVPSRCYRNDTGIVVYLRT